MGITTAPNENLSPQTQDLMTIEQQEIQNQTQTELGDLSQEILNAPSKLEKENCKIDSSTRERKVITMEINKKNRKVRVKVHPEGDVREYIGYAGRKVENEVFPFVGEQFFTYKAAQRETLNAGKEWISDYKMLERIIARSKGKSKEEKYQNFLKENNVKFTGMWNSLENKMEEVNKKAFWRFADGEGATLFTDRVTENALYHDFGMQVRCLQ